MTSEVSGRSGTVLGEVRLSTAEADSVARLVDELAVAFGRVDDPRLLRAVTGWGHRLPAALHEQLLSMRYEESVGGFVVRGALSGVDPGPTPAHWGAGLDTLRHDLWLLLVAAQLGDPVAWSVWQGGELVNDVLPMAGEVTAQTGLGSEAELDLHVEEALYDDRCDGLALGCLRNPDRVPTIVAAADAVDWRSLDVEVLFEPRYLIGDEESGRVRPALFGAADSPYLRVDMPYMRARRGDARAAAAFSGLCAQLRANAIDVVLDAGDVLVLDNYRTVHGRRPFQPRFDGTDRWLRRCTTTRDLRATRALRDGVTSRVITPDLSKEES